MDILTIVISFIVLIFSAILHEIAHGLVADRLGDPTARLAGRLTLNPKSHIDPVMTILLPVILYIGSGGQFTFGGAKPVPVDPFNLRDYRKDMALISLAGPGTNIALAIVASALVHLLVLLFPHNDISYLLGILLYIVINVNIMLAIFNLLPIPPLDGSKIFALLLPEREANSYLSLGNLGLAILLLLLNFPIAGFSLSQFLDTLIILARSALL